MKKSAFKTTLSTALCVALVSFTGVAYAEEDSPIPKVSDGFRSSLTPYFWMPSVNGPLDVHNTKIGELHMNNTKVLDSLSMGAMMSGQVNYGRWGIFGNGVFAKLRPSGTTSRLPEGGTVNADTSLWLGVYTLAGTYTAYASDSVILDVMLGARFLNLNTKTNLAGSVVRTGPTQDRTNYTQYNSTDAIGGVQGRIRIGESQFFVPFYLDGGGGSAYSKFSSQQILGIGYTHKNMDMMLVYNNYYYKINKGDFSARLNMGGPALATTFRF